MYERSELLCYGVAEGFINFRFTYLHAQNKSCITQMFVVRRVQTCDTMLCTPSLLILSIFYKFNFMKILEFVSVQNA